MNAFHICFTIALFAVASTDIPSYIKICSQNDPDLNKCIFNSIEQLRDNLAKGIPELDVPPIEPLFLENLRLLRGPNSASFDMNLTNIEVYGASTFKIDNLKVDINKLLFTYNLTFSKLEFQGKYSIDAKILLFQLKGAGNLNGTFRDYRGNVVMKAKRIHKDNDTYLHFDKMKYGIYINKLLINLNNLFNGDKLLGDATNELLNENHDLILQDITPLLQNSLENLFLDVANKITRTFTYNELFPEN
ncbi:PREDICTED: protein takeout-like isoform X2 [Dinoponera quadriceps]|uniref:Protein takeout-like isoform X2 n=1 Tax=Dinoponera quadriceps TaxID=609295 RepID=A0A6P3X1A8_DINQU|nr:PREDICTED: protein takeout-like isoform X2 [Dinoponera quadriceps]